MYFLQTVPLSDHLITCLRCDLSAGHVISLLTNHMLIWSLHLYAAYSAGDLVTISVCAARKRSTTQLHWIDYTLVVICLSARDSFWFTIQADEFSTLTICIWCFAYNISVVLKVHVRTWTVWSAWDHVVGAGFRIIADSTWSITVMKTATPNVDWWIWLANAIIRNDFIFYSVYPSWPGLIAENVPCADLRVIMHTQVVTAASFSGVMASCHVSCIQENGSFWATFSTPTSIDFTRWGELYKGGTEHKHQN